MASITPGPNNRRSFLALDDLDDRTERGIRQGFFSSGNDLNNELNKQMLAKDKTGRVYISRIRGGSRRRHRASAEGQTAANRSGRMRKARGYQLSGADQLEWGIRSGKGAEYAAFLEEGTNKMSARPSLGNAVMATQRNISNNFSSSIEDELNR